MYTTTMGSSLLTEKWFKLQVTLLKLLVFCRKIVLSISIRPQLIFLLLVSNSQNAQEALTQPSRCHTFCYSFKSKAGTGTAFGKTAGVPQATPGTALEGCPLQWHSGTGHSPVPVLPKLSVHPWDSWMHFQVLRKGLKLWNPIFKMKYVFNSWLSRPASFLTHL